MKLEISELRRMIKGVLYETLNEADPVPIPQTRSADPGTASVSKAETPGERKRRLRQKFKQQPASNSTDIQTPEGRNEILDKVYYEFGDVKARINIIKKLASEAMKAKNRQEYKANLIQIFENLTSLKNRDMLKLQKGYTEAAILSGLKKVPMREANLNPDTPDGRINLTRKLFNAIGELNRIAAEGNKMILNARQAGNVSVFLNELKAFGNIIREMQQKLVELNAAFVETFQEYERQRGR